MDNPTRGRFTMGILLNYGSVAIMAVGGLMFNYIIASFYDAATLGVFNISYSVYIVLSQISTCGIHMSVLKEVSEKRSDILEQKSILSSAFVAVAITSILVFVGSETALGFLSFEMRRKQAIANVLPALVFFSMNKVLLNYLNAIVEMIAYAFFQGLRNILICFGIITISILKYDGTYLTLGFLFGEFVLLVMIFCYLFRRIGRMEKPGYGLVKKLISFGIRILPSNVVLELNTKIDLLCLGWLITDDAMIGVYSFVSLFAEGFYQIYMVIRRYINPYLSEWNKNKTKWWEVYSSVRNRCILLSVPLVAFMYIVYHFVISMLDKNTYIKGELPLIILISSVAINGVFIVYGNVMSQLGEPLMESKANCITVLVNVILNTMLILCLGINGAALATALSYFCYSCFVYRFIKRNSRG